MRCRWRCRWAIAGWPCAWRSTPTCPRAPPRSPTAPPAPDELGAVADAFAGRGRFFEAGARRRAGAPDWPRAAALYRRAGAPIDEARARVRAGELREAGLLYERLVAQGSSDEAAAARLALGRLLSRLGRHEEAARHLQVAARTPALRTAASRALCAPLLALGFRGAAAEVVDRLRKDQPTLPRSPEDFVALEEAEAAAAEGDAGLPAKLRGGAGHGGRAPLRAAPAAGRRRHRPRLRGRRHAARHADRAQAAPARRRAPAIRSGRRTCASRARRRRPGGSATPTSSRCTTRSRRRGCSCSS